MDTCPVPPTLTSRFFLTPCTLTPVTLHSFHMLGKRGVLMSWIATRYINGYHKEGLSEFVQPAFPPPPLGDTGLSWKDGQTPSVPC